MKKILFLLISILSCTIAYAIEVRGKLIDSNNFEPIEFASIALLKKDSTFVAEGLSNNNGIFSISGNFPQQDYILRISYLGYTTSFITISNLINNIDLDDIDIVSEDYMMDEVSITSNRTINKIDRQIILPSQMEVKSSTNSFDLLNKMFLPGVIIDPVNRTIQAQNKDVQVRINGIKATMQELVALKSEDINRVEYFQDPGIRFGDEEIGAVIDLIVLRSKESGGYISIDGRNAPFIEFGDDQVSMKANHKASQFSLDYSISYRAYDKRWSDKTADYNFPNNEVQLTQNGEGAPMQYQTHNINLAYNLIKPDKYMFNVSFKDQIHNQDHKNRYNTFYTNNLQETYIYNKSTGATNTPSLDIYYRQELKNKQSLTFNMVGTYINSDNESWYEETMKQ